MPEEPQDENAWRTIERCESFTKASNRRARSEAKGLETKIRRRANGIFEVRVRGEESEMRAKIVSAIPHAVRRGGQGGGPTDRLVPKGFKATQGGKSSD